MNTPQKNYALYLPLLCLVALLFCLSGCESKADIEPKLNGKDIIDCIEKKILDERRDTTVGTVGYTIIVHPDTAVYDSCKQVVCVDNICDTTTVVREPHGTIFGRRYSYFNFFHRSIGRHSLSLNEDNGTALFIGNGLLDGSTDSLPKIYNSFALNVQSNDWLNVSDEFINESAGAGTNRRYVVNESVYAPYDQSVYFVEGSRITRYKTTSNELEIVLEFDPGKIINSNVVYNATEKAIQFLTIKSDSIYEIGHEIASFDLISQQLSYRPIKRPLIFFIQSALAWRPENNTLYIYSSFYDDEALQSHSGVLAAYHMDEEEFEILSFFNPKLLVNRNTNLLYNPVRNSMILVGYESIVRLNGLVAESELEIWEFDLSSKQWREHQVNFRPKITLSNSSQFTRQSTYRAVQDLVSGTLLLSFIDNRCYKYDYNLEQMDEIAPVPLN